MQVNQMNNTTIGPDDQDSNQNFFFLHIWTKRNISHTKFTKLDYTNLDYTTLGIKEIGIKEIHKIGLNKLD